MKKTFVYRFAGIIFACIITSIAYGQPSNSLAKLKAQPLSEKIISLYKQLNLTRDSDFIFRNDINTKAVRNFIRDYENVTGAIWFKSANGLFVVYFTNENIQYWIYYNKKGDFEFMLRHYSEEKLPRDVRHQVRSNYYDFNIYHVSEIRYYGKTEFFVRMEDKTCWKKIKVVDDEMEVVEEISKGRAGL